MIRFNCHRCGMLIQAADTGTGRDAKCPGCGLMLVIPSAAEGIPTPPPAPAETSGEPAPTAAPPVAASAPPGPTPTPPVVGPPPLSASTAADIGPAPSAVPVPPNSVPVPPTINAGSLSALSGAMPVPPRGMPIAPRGASRSFLDAASDPADSAAIANLLNDTARTDNGDRAATVDDHGHSLPLSNDGIRGLGLAAIGFGIIGLVLSWIPFAGLALAVAGLAASGIAMVVGSSRRGAPLGFALTGAMIGVVAAGLGGYSTYSSLTEPVAQTAKTAKGKERDQSVRSASSTVAQSVEKPLTAAEAAVRFSEGAFVGAAGGDARDDRDPVKFAAGAFREVRSSFTKEIAAAGNQARARNGRPRLVFGGADHGNGLVISAAKPEGAGEDGTADKRSDGTAPETPIQWAAAEKAESQGSGPLQVTVSKVVIGKVVSYPIGDLQTLINVTSEPYMTIWLKIKNTDAAGSAEFSGWMTAQAEKEKAAAQLVDDHGREHKPVRPFNKDEAIQRTTPPGKIFAGQTANDAVVFRVLMDDVESMDLTLPGKAIGRDEDLHFRIPRSMFVRDESNPLLGGVRN